MSEQEGKNENVTKTTAKEDKKTSLAREIWEWVYTLAIAIVIAMLIKGFIFDIVRVDGSSMFPTLVDNDRLIVTKLGYTPKQGDIIILDSEYKNREEYFDRLAESKDKEELSSFEMLDEPYYDGLTTSIDPTVEYPITVDDDCVFVMGDNRTRSKDSRSSELGQVPFKAILGKSQVRIWPLSDIGLTK